MKYLSIILTLLSSSICFAHRDLETGIFLPRDPTGHSDGPSVYCYVNCNPIYSVYEAYETRPVEWSDGTTGNPDPQRANTKDEEAELGLLNEGMRYRDLETGTFLTRDPIGYADGPNMYCYVHCNPITSFDPLGLDNDLFSEFDLLNQSIQNSVPPGISCNIDGSSYGVYNPGQSMIDRIFSPIENSVEGAWSVATNPRVQGGVQFLGGLAQGLAGGTATYGSGGTATWGGVFLMGHGVDDMQAGWQKLWSGQHADTATHQALAGLAEAVPGVSTDAANTFATFAEMTAAGLAAFNVAGQQMQRAASELSYTANPSVSTTPVDWPPNRGFMPGEGNPSSVLPGNLVDRYGGTGGSFLSPAGTPASARSLAPGTTFRPLNTYKVMKPFEVDAGRVAPWFGQPGEGIQYDLGMRTIQDMIDGFYLDPL